MTGIGAEKLDSDSSPNKYGRRCNGVDRISELPDDVIVHIMSFLPLKEAAATSLVAPRWSQLWRYTPNLVFQNNPDSDPIISIPVTLPPEEDDFLVIHSLSTIEWVNSILNSHRAASVKLFERSFYLHDYHVLTKWLRFALSRGVETLQLDFQGAEDVLDCNILNGIESSDYRSLKELKFANLEVSGEAIELFIRHCPFLERLVLESVYVASDLVVGGSLKVFEMVSDCGMSTRVCAPNLTCLRYDSDLSSLFLESVPNLVEASFCVSGCVADTMDRIANVAAKLEILTITLNRPKAFSVPQMPRLKKLVLDCYSVNTEFLLPVARLLQASPYLREFSLKISDMKFPVTETIFEVPERGTSPPHHHLDVFEFLGFYYRAVNHIELVKYIVDNCVALREITIAPSPHATEYSKRVQTIPSHDRRHRDVVASEIRKAALFKRQTERLLASKVPHNIKLRVV